MAMTYLRVVKGIIYFVTVVDWYTRRVLSWGLPVTMGTDFCIAAVEDAIDKYGKPDIMNVPQGSQLTPEAFTELLKDNDIKVSSYGKGV